MCGIAEQRNRAVAQRTGNRMPKMGERRTGQIVVGQCREYSIDRVGPSGEIGPDHVDRTSGSDEVGRPWQVEPPLQIGASGRPQANVAVLADNDQCGVLVGDVRKGDQSLPAAPAGRLRVQCADGISNHRVQTIRTDQQISFGRAAVFELDPDSVVRTDHPDHPGVASDAIGRKAFQQTVKQDSTWDHPNRCAQPVHDRGQVQSGERSTGRCHDPHSG